MRILSLTFIGLTLLAIALAHHDREEEHLLDSLIESHIELYGSDKGTNRNCLYRCRNAGASLNNYVDNILRRVFDKVKSNLANKEPYSVPDLPIKEIKDKNVQVNITLTSVKENKASQLVVNKLNNNMFLMTEQFDVIFPTLELEGNYDVNGKVLNRDVSGNGIFHIWMTNLHTWGKAYAKLSRGAVQLKKLNVDYTIEGIKATVTGLRVSGLSQQEVEKLLGTALLQYYTDNERVVSDTIGGIVVNQANAFLKGMSMTDLLKWLQHYLHPTSS